MHVGSCNVAAVQDWDDRQHVVVLHKTAALLRSGLAADGAAVSTGVNQLFVWRSPGPGCIARATTNGVPRLQDLQVRWQAVTTCGYSLLEQRLRLQWYCQAGPANPVMVHLTP